MPMRGGLNRSDQRLIIKRLCMLLPVYLSEILTRVIQAEVIQPVREVQVAQAEITRLLWQSSMPTSIDLRCVFPFEQFVLWPCLKLKRWILLLVLIHIEVFEQARPAANHQEQRVGSPLFASFIDSQDFEQVNSRRV